MTATLEQLVRIPSQLGQELLDYFLAVRAAPDRQEKLPAYLGGRRPSALCVEPDVLKRERRADVEGGGQARGRHEEEPGRGSPAEKAEPRSLVARETLDVGDESLYGERMAEIDRRVPWVTERLAMARSPHPARVVIKGAPGQGKSFLTEMTARALASEAHDALASQSLGAETCPLPIVLPINRLSDDPVPRGASPQEVLRLSLAAALRETVGCPPRVSNYLAAHAHEARTWLFLDALDEAGDEAGLTRVFAVLREWQCRVIITSRPYGYEGRRLPFDVTEVRLAPFTLQQARLFVQRWFGEGGAQDHMNALLSRNSTVQQLSQVPFLLTLLCWVAERHEIADDITRTQIYDRVTRDLLGMPLVGTGPVDEDREGELLPILAPLIFTFFRENAGRRPMPSARLKATIALGTTRPVLLDEHGRRAPLSALQNLTPIQQADYLLEELCRKRFLV